MRTGRRTEPKADSSGFTLIELIVVAAIIAILAGIASVNITPIFTQSVRSQAQDLQQMLADTRTAAYAQDKDEKTYLEVGIDPSNGRLVAREYVNGTVKETKYLGRYTSTLSISQRTTTMNSGIVSKVTDTGKTPLPADKKLYVAFRKGSGEIYCFSYADSFGSAEKNYDSASTVSDAVITMQKGSIVFEVTADALTGSSSCKRIY